MRPTRPLRSRRLPARLLAVPLAVVVLAGCASDTERGRADVRERVEAVMDAANDRDPTGLRLAVADLLQVLRAQTGRSLTPQEAQAIANAARALAEKAERLQPMPTPTPVETPTQEPSEEPSPTPEETEEPEEVEEPSPEPEPEPTKTKKKKDPPPEPEPEPEESEAPPVEVEVSPPTADGGPSPTPSPSAGTA